MVHRSPVVPKPLSGDEFDGGVDISSGEDIAVGRMPVLGIHKARRAAENTDVPMTEDRGGSGVERTPDAAVEAEAREEQRGGEHDASAVVQRPVAEDGLSDRKVLGHRRGGAEHDLWDHAVPVMDPAAKVRMHLHESKKKRPEDTG